MPLLVLQPLHRFALLHLLHDGFGDCRVEIVDRRALGAGRREIVALVGRRALACVAGGIIAGVASALALTRLIASQLWGVSPTDPVTFAAVSILLVAIAAAACVLPARRALSVDPTLALRND